MMKLAKILLMMALLLSITVESQSQDSHTTEDKELVNVIESKHERHKESGKASYYGLRYKNGRKTASGEAYNKDAFTAAHKTLPFGTIVRVTNKKNGKYVDVQINDRGPYAKGRVIDLSVAAARKIGMIKDGIVPVYITVIEPKEFLD